ncbi:MAG: hypothetical protein LAP13_00575 [Acidobacteriia bacterium]|nr:hypothetical protein [Terriglobia bacterium]
MRRGRTLIYIPIIHTQADMGALGESVQRLKIQRLGRRGWERNVNLVDQYWTRVEQAVQSLSAPRQPLRVYQDGLPVCGREIDIVADLAKAGSRNHRLLMRLKEKGAALMGTESSALLVEEYQLMKGTFALEKAEAVAHGGRPSTALRDSLLKRRDQYIARRINETLLAGETGLIFLGVLHSLAECLDRDIHIVCPIFQPLDQRKSHGARR